MSSSAQILSSPCGDLINQNKGEAKSDLGLVVFFREDYEKEHCDLKNTMKLLSRPRHWRWGFATQTPKTTPAILILYGDLTTESSRPLPMKLDSTSTRETINKMRFQFKDGKEQFKPVFDLKGPLTNGPNPITRLTVFFTGRMYFQGSCDGEVEGYDMSYQHDYELKADGNPGEVIMFEDVFKLMEEKWSITAAEKRLVCPQILQEAYMMRSRLNEVVGTNSTF